MHQTPNTTQIPNELIDVWMPKLTPHEWKITCLIARQTFGWVEDPETKRRKQKDWMTLSYITKYTGVPTRTAQRAIANLVEKHDLVETCDKNGNLLETGAERAVVGGRIYYRIRLQADHKKEETATHATQAGADKTPEKEQKHNPRHTGVGTHATQAPLQNKNITKGYAKATHGVGRDIHRPGDNQHKSGKSPTGELLGLFKHYSERIRGEPPQFTRGKDGALVGRAIRQLGEGRVRLLLLWHLSENRTMAPTIGAALCDSTMQRFIDQSHQQTGFYAWLDRLEARHRISVTTTPEEHTAAINAMRAALAEKLTTRT